MSNEPTMDARLDRIDARLDRIDARFEEVNKQFGRVNEQFEEVNKQFGRVNEQIDKLTVAVVKGFDRIDKELETKASKEDVNRLYDLIDKIAKQQEIDNDERLVMGHQLDRLDRWVHEVAQKIGYELTT